MLRDPYGRLVDYLRVSVTDRCDLRCVYCMPPEGIPLKPVSEILTYDELIRTVRVAASLGVRKVRVTGGERLGRRGGAAGAAGDGVVRPPGGGDPGDSGPRDDHERDGAFRHGGPVAAGGPVPRQYQPRHDPAGPVRRAPPQGRPPAGDRRDRGGDPGGAFPGEDQRGAAPRPAPERGGRLLHDGAGNR